MSEKKRILVLLTGGTLAMVRKEGRLTTASNKDILNKVPDLKEIADIDVIELFNI